MLHRTILSYPLCPFFVLFCNVVGTSNPRDFQLLQDVVNSVSSLVIESKYVERLCRLCSTLLALCKPLVARAADPIPCSETPEIAMDPTSLDNPSAKNQNSARDDAAVSQQADTLPVTSWDDEMMWQLFHYQPSLNWCNSDILDQALWDTNTGPITENSTQDWW